MGRTINTIRKNGGFTILELMVVVAIIGIGAAVTGFSIRDMLPDMRLKAAARDVMSDLNAARLRAVRENKRVVVRFDTNADRYTVFIDDQPANNVLDDGETVLKTVSLPEQVTLHSAAIGGAAQWIRFNGEGWPNAAGNVRLRSSDGHYRGVVISMAGKVRINASEDGGTTWN